MSWLMESDPGSSEPSGRPRLLVTGANGYLGRRVCRRAQAGWVVHALVGPHGESKRDDNRLRCDIRDAAEVEVTLRTVRPDAVIHTAAVNPGGPEEAMISVNASGTRNVAESSASIGARLIHVSTDVVHDGTRAPYDDTAEPTPLYTYARSKAEAEQEVITAHADAVIVRTSLIYGLDQMDRGIATLARRLAAGQRLQLYSDSLRQPIWVETLAEALLRLARLPHVGTVNVAGGQILSREHFIRKTLTWWGVEHEGSVDTIRVADLADPHPLDLTLRLERAHRWLGMRLPGVDEVLAGCSPPADDDTPQD